MKIKSGNVIKRLNGKSVMTEQEPIIIDGYPKMLNGSTQLTGGRELTVGDVISNILTTKKVEQFNTLKAYVLAQRFDKSACASAAGTGEVTDLDESDYFSLREVVENNDQYVPTVLVQVLQASIEAKDKGDRKPAKQFRRPALKYMDKQRVQAKRGLSPWRAPVRGLF